MHEEAGVPCLHLGEGGWIAGRPAEGGGPGWEGDGDGLAMRRGSECSRVGGCVQNGRRGPRGCGGCIEFFVFLQEREKTKRKRGESGLVHVSMGDSNWARGKLRGLRGAGMSKSLCLRRRYVHEYCLVEWWSRAGGCASLWVSAWWLLMSLVFAGYE